MFCLERVDCGSFIFLISGFSKLISVIALFEDVQITSELLKEIASVDPEKGFPDLTDLLKFYQVRFLLLHTFLILANQTKIEFFHDTKLYRVCLFEMIKSVRIHNRCTFTLPISPAHRV